MLFGKPVHKPDEAGMELKEVTFQMPPDVLRLIASFLSSMADKMESGGFSRCSHVHMSSVNESWLLDFPELDIIVMAPINSRPPVVKPSS